MHQFLTTVAPTSGLNCIVEFVSTPDGSVRPVHRPVYFADAVATDGVVSNAQRSGNETYFALGAFVAQPDGKFRRVQDAVVSLRSFWLDIDAGPNKAAKHGDKVYPDQQTAINALWAEVTNHTLPEPTYVIDSGEGLHVYWCADADIPAPVWKQAATRLNRWCQQSGLRVDPARTADQASILRPVGTLHHKSGKRVQAIYHGAVHNAQALLQAVQSLPVVGDTPVSGMPAPMIAGQMPVLPGMAGSSMAGIGDYQPSSFGKIIELQQCSGTGCAQLLHAYDRQATLDEPLWYAALAVAQFCIVDRDEWIHKLSFSHPQYVRGETEAKAQQAKGPTSCAAYMAKNPSGCEGCPHKGRITNPIVLGYNPANRPVKVVATLPGASHATELLIPEMPYGFFRKPEGGVWTHVPKVGPDGKEVKGEMEEKMVFPHDVYLFERVRDGDARQIYRGRSHSPHDGVVEFQLTSDNVHTFDAKYKSAILAAGIAIDGVDRWKLSMTFFNRSRENLVLTKAASEAVTQMGWQAGNKEFVLGDTVMTPLGQREATLKSSHIAQKFRNAFRPSTHDTTGMAADLDTWRTVLGEMYNTQESVANQFVIATALGAPFSAKYALESHSGGIISLSSSGSGRGKTMTCQLALRVFLDPGEATFSSKTGTTANAFMSVLGYMNSLPVLRDEITELTSDEVVNLVYDSTRLGDKERAQGSENDIRGNRMKWRTFFYATANTSMYDLISMGREVADGPTRRVTEIQIPELTYLKDGRKAQALVRRISAVRGTPGRVLIDWMVRNEEAAQAMWERMMNYFIQQYEVTNEERYWVNHLVSGCVGALAGERLGLLPFSPKQIIAFAGEQLRSMRRRTGHRVLDKTDYLSQFLVDNAMHTLVVNSTTADETKLLADLPLRAVYIRIERSVAGATSSMAYINSIAIKQWCEERRIVQADFELELRRRGAIPDQSKNMLANTANYSVPPQKVWALPLTK